MSYEILPCQYWNAYLISIRWAEHIYYSWYFWIAGNRTGISHGHDRLPMIILRVKVIKRRYLVCPPFASTTVCHLLSVDAIKMQTPLSLECNCKLLDSLLCMITLANKASPLVSSRKCSIGFRSGDLEGHGRTRWCRKGVARRAVCGLAFLWWKIRFPQMMMGRTYDRKVSSL